MTDLRRENPALGNDDYATLSWNLLSQKDWLRISKPLMHRIGDRETIILYELVSLDHYHRNRDSFNGWFRASNTLLFKHTAQKIDTQRKSISKLVELGLVEKRISKGHVPATLEYRINHKNLVHMVMKGWPDEFRQNTKSSLGKKPKLDMAKNLNYNKDSSNEEPNDYKTLGADAPVGVSQPAPSSPDEKENTFSTWGLPQQGCAPPRAVKRTRTAPVPPTPKPPPDPNVIATAKLMQSFAPLYRQINQAPLKANTENWYKNRASLQLMLTKDELPLERIQEVIGWLMRHHSDTYTPKFSNAYKFRQKFFDIERIKRNGSSNGNNGSSQNSNTIAPEFLRDNSIYGKRVDIVIDNTR